MKRSERGVTDYVIILIGLIIGFALIGFFRSDRIFFDTINLKTLLRLPCGLTYSDITDNQKIVFPQTITGYINGCGWDRNGMKAGTAQVFDNKGFPVTSPTNLIISENGTELPLAFTVTLKASFAPETDTGQIMLRSNSGLIKVIPISF